MPATWKTIRVFISSPFRDMHAERDHLVAWYSRNWESGPPGGTCTWSMSDVTEEDAQRGKALEICLREIEDCRPFFIRRACL